MKGKMSWWWVDTI